MRPIVQISLDIIDLKEALATAHMAIRAGVDKVSLVDGRVPHSVMLEIFTDEGIGTEVVV